MSLTVSIERPHRATERRPAVSSVSAVARDRSRRCGVGIVGMTTRSLSAVRFRVLIGVAAFAAAAAVLASCSSDESAAGQATASTVSGSPSTSAASPTALAPADGEDPSACLDGSCEIRVTAPVTVPLPAHFGVGPLTVTAIDAGTVTMVLPLTGSQLSKEGDCSAGITGPTANAPAHVDMTCRAGANAVVNDMNLEVVAISDRSAVLRIRPTS